MSTHRNTTNLSQGHPAPECQTFSCLGALDWSTVAELSRPWTVTATIAAGGLSGGITSTMAGADFWDGVCNGLSCAGLNHAMHLVVEGGWAMLKGIHQFCVMHQPDSWTSNPKYCKYTCLAMVEKFFLGDFARTAEELCQIAEENGYDKYDLFYLYSKLCADYDVSYLPNNKVSSIVYTLLEGCPIIAGAEKFSSSGTIVSGHASVVTGVGFNDSGYELQLADPMYYDNKFNYISSSDINKQYLLNNVQYEMIVFRPK